MTRFYGFSEADYHAMSFEMFQEYIGHVTEISRIESGKELSNDERVERQMKKTEQAMRRKKRNTI